MGELTMKDQINAEIDSRKLKKAIEDGLMTAEEVANAEIWILCSCGEEQPDTDICRGCGKEF